MAITVLTNAFLIGCTGRDPADGATVWSRASSQGRPQVRQGRAAQGPGGALST